MDAAVPLPGGYMHKVVRIGDTVRRPVGPFPRRVLEHLGSTGWAGAPRVLGDDTLSYLDGHVAWEPDQPASVNSEASVVRAAELVREFHDRLAGTGLAGDAETVCHNDLSPKNTVYRDLGDGLRPYAFIDWDLAAPGRRIEDVAHTCWQYTGLSPNADVARSARLIAAVAATYGVSDRVELLDTVLWWQDRCWRGIAAAGPRHGAFAHVDGVRDTYGWTLANRRALERG
jgi:hypothetical protein